VAVRLDKNGEREWHAAGIPSSLPYWLQKCPPLASTERLTNQSWEYGYRQKEAAAGKRENPPINHDSQSRHYPLPKFRFSIVAASLSALSEGLRQHGR
jgi:hypothetical protein